MQSSASTSTTNSGLSSTSPQPSTSYASSSQQAHLQLGAQNALPESNNAGLSNSSQVSDPWDAAIDLFDEVIEGDASASVGQSNYLTSFTVPAIVVGEAPLSEGMVIVEVNSELQKLLDDPHVELFVDVDDQVVVNPTQTDESGHFAVEQGFESDEVSSDLEDDVLASPPLSQLSSTPFDETSEDDPPRQPYSPSLDSCMTPALATMDGLINFHGSPHLYPNELCGDRPSSPGMSQLLDWKHSLLASSPTPSDHLPFFSWGNSFGPPSPPPPTSIVLSSIWYPPSPSTFSRQLSEVLTRNRALTGGCLGIEITPNFTLVRTPVAVCLQPPFTNLRALDNEDKESDDLAAASQRPKLEITIAYDSLWDDEELSALISPVGSVAIHPYRTLWPTPMTRTSSLTPSSSNSLSSTSAPTPHSPPIPMQHSLPFSSHPFHEEEYDYGEDFKSQAKENPVYFFISPPRHTIP